MRKLEQALGDAPIQDEYKKKMEQVARDLDRVFNGLRRGNARKVGFVVMVFPFNDDQHVKIDDARCNYISNGADRHDVVVLMKVMIKRFEGQPHLEGHG
jgi:hypothetical protein